MSVPSVTTTYSPATAVNLGTTLRPLHRGPFDPTMRVGDAGVWRTMLTPLGAASLHLSTRGSRVEARAWGDGAEWAIAGVPELLGAGDDWSGLDVSGNAFLADSLRRNPGLRLMRTCQVFEMLLVAILEQKVTNVEARRSWRTLLTRFGDPAPGPAP
ncbi:MAG: DNA-3-methyladenine glycosylase 2 family protein, partial [Microbacteriaceae bacterium]|nr:DNA-3-methyladenine glycosylase 2 family protein [Microbacteriaceae bacterium]